MYHSSAYYPAGAEHDSMAPYNEPPTFHTTYSVEASVYDPDGGMPTTHTFRVTIHTTGSPYWYTQQELLPLITQAVASQLPDTADFDITYYETA